MYVGPETKRAFFYKLGRRTPADVEINFQDVPDQSRPSFERQTSLSVPFTGGGGVRVGVGVSDSHYLLLGMPNLGTCRLVRQHWTTGPPRIVRAHIFNGYDLLRNANQAIQILRRTRHIDRSAFAQKSEMILKVIDFRR